MKTPPVKPAQALLSFIGFCVNYWKTTFLMQLTVGQRSSLVASLFNNSRWVTERVSFQTCCLEGFSEFRLNTVELTGDFWLHCRLQKCGEVGSAVFHAPPVWHKPVSPLQCLPGCIMFLWQTGWLGLRSSRQRWTDWKDRREGKERETERGGRGGREKGLEVLNGVPRLSSAKDSLAVIWAVSTLGLPRHIPEYWLHFFFSLSLSMSPQHPPRLLPPGPDNE